MFSRRSIGNTFSEREKPLPVFEQILEHAKKGDAVAITALYRRFLPGVFGYVATRVPDRLTAEDLTSEVFVKMIEGIEGVRTTEEAGMVAWLLQVARITVANYYRKREKQPECVSLSSVNEERDTGISKSSTAISHHPDTDPVLRSEAREDWKAVASAINSLTEEQRQVLVGRLILGYDVATRQASQCDQSPPVPCIKEPKSPLSAKEIVVFVSYTSTLASLLLPIMIIIRPLALPLELPHRLI